MNGGIGVNANENRNNINWNSTPNNRCQTAGKIIYNPSGNVAPVVIN